MEYISDNRMSEYCAQIEAEKVKDYFRSNYICAEEMDEALESIAQEEAEEERALNEAEHQILIEYERTNHIAEYDDPEDDEYQLVEFDEGGVELAEDYED